MAIHPYISVLGGPDCQPDAEASSNDRHGIDEDLGDNVKLKKTDGWDVEAKEYRTQRCKECPR